MEKLLPKIQQLFRKYQENESLKKYILTRKKVLIRRKSTL